MTTREISNELLASPHSRWSPARIDDSPTLAPSDLTQEADGRDKDFYGQDKDTPEPLVLTNIVKHKVNYLFERKTPLLAIVAATALTLGGLSYFLIPSGGPVMPPSEQASTTVPSQANPTLPPKAKTPVQEEKLQAALPDQSSRLPPESGNRVVNHPAQPLLPWPERAASHPSAASSSSTDSPRQTAATSPQRTAVLQTPSSVVQAPDVLFLQNPGVNIRSTPSSTGSVIGSAPKGARFEVTERDGEWRKVRGAGMNGWINARFLRPTAPR